VRCWAIGTACAGTQGLQKQSTSCVGLWHCHATGKAYETTCAWCHHANVLTPQLQLRQ